MKEDQYQKISKYIMDNHDKRMLFIELGVGRILEDVRVKMAESC